MIRRYLLVAAAAAGVAAAESAPADEPRRLQGLFCNAELQIDQALEDIAAGVSPRRAADLANGDAVVCTYVDRIVFLIARPVAIGETARPFVKYRGELIGVMVGNDLRPIIPRAELYFLTPQRIGDHGIERRT